ncbi:hypothetical protein NP493_838g02013 [Ridgeia piscesae]|uniref:Integrase catalytic domain-containing protein n=1 Tax=Ridgeia piscesae TaxID=27915 RepID=A0AAD9NNV0_RIDPI|nr:hypothetical protein NP493_838g02013 [Ridgeia piscesae]
MLIIVFGLERFHQYAYGRHVTIEIDHKPLGSITRKHLMNAPPRLMRILLRKQKYDFTMKYVPGKDIPIADGLSYYYSSYTIIRKLSSTTSGAIVSKLKLIFSEFGIPNIFISDNARQCDSAEFRKFETEYDFKHETSSSRYPQFNGKAERYVGVVKKTLPKAYEAREDPRHRFALSSYDSH